MKKPTRKKSWAWVTSSAPCIHSGGYGTIAFRNDYYHVWLTRMDNADNISGWLHLSIKSVDNVPIRDWRHFQRIKDTLAGPHREAVELYPRQDRVVDEANQYHLWVLPLGTEIAIGFKDGTIAGPSVAGRPAGGRQREFEEGDPYRLLQIEDFATLPRLQNVHAPGILTGGDQCPQE